MSTKLLDALINYRLATTESPGYALLETETDVDSDFHAATASAVFKVQNDANDRVLRAGDMMTGVLDMGGNDIMGVNVIYVVEDILLSSDGRFKTDVRTISNALEKVTTMRGVTYRSTRDPVQKLRMGLIAQELEQVAPEVVNTDGDTGYKSVAYGNLVGVLVEAIKELDCYLSEAKTDVKELNDTVKELNGQLSDERTVTKELNDTVKELEEKVAVLERRNEPPA